MSAALLLIGAVLLLIGFSINPTRTIESCATSGGYTTCVQTTVPNTAPRGVLIFGGILSIFGSIVALGIDRDDNSDKSGPEKARELLESHQTRENDE